MVKTSSPSEVQSQWYVKCTSCERELRACTSRYPAISMYGNGYIRSLRSTCKKLGIAPCEFVAELRLDELDAVEVASEEWRHEYGRI